jgi:poly-gamma-glutamate capsule biosynthesis protein CapA/YwtB (metallophosphatase superfamily)
LDRKFHFDKIASRWFIRAAGALAALIFLVALAPEPQFVQVTFLGDVMLGRGVYIASAHAKDWQPFHELILVIKNADILGANLESPLTIAPVVTRGYALCAPPAQVEALTRASFDLVTFANNHTGDCGETGRIQTVQTVRAFGIRVAEPSPYVEYINSHGRRLAFIALDDVTHPLDQPVALAAIRTAREKSEVVIVSIHWGNEYQSAPSTRQRTLAANLANAGARVIIGHHPHVIQPMEVIKRGEENAPTLVFYSLGNALFDQHGMEDTRTGEAVTLVFSPGGSVTYWTRQFELDPNRGTIRKLLP